jgi:hypothetical protein
MKRHFLMGTLLLAACGCSTMNNTEKGAGIGALAGGALGAGVGALAHAPVAGAAIGAGTGAILGGLTGAHQDHEERVAQVEQTHAIAAAQQAQASALRIDEVVQMSQNGVPESNIITEIRHRGISHAPTADEISYLARSGVSSSVITAMQDCQPRAVYVAPPPTQVIYTRPVYVEPYPPPVYGGFYYRRGCW